jgi:hypothetical protein
MVTAAVPARMPGHRPCGENPDGIGLLDHGEMAERFNAAVLKTAEPETVPWVRIPLSP